MKFRKEFNCHSVETLTGGKFYWIHTVSRCFRIQEVDHFRKDQVVDVVGWLSPEGDVHHFNRPESEQAAVTPLTHLFQTNNLKEITFFEFEDSAIEPLTSDKYSLKKEDPGVVLLHKLVQAFHSSDKSSQETKTFDVKALKTEYMKEYVQSLELVE